MKKINSGLLFALMLSVTGPLCFGFDRTLEASKNEAITAAHQLEEHLGSRAAQITNITQSLSSKLQQVNAENVSKKEQLAALKHQYPTQGQQNAQRAQETVRSLWKKMNKPPGWSADQYQNATSDQIKAAWRKHKEKEERDRMRNSR